MKFSGFGAVVLANAFANASGYVFVIVSYSLQIRMNKSVYHFKGRVGDIRFRYLCRGNPLCPDYTVYILQLLEELRRILGEIFVYYYVCFGLAFCLGDWSAGED